MRARNYSVEIGLVAVVAVAIFYAVRHYKESGATPPAALTAIASPQAAPGINTAVPASAVSWSNGAPLTRATNVSVDTVTVGSMSQTVAGPRPSTISLDSSDTVEIKGWAVDAAAGRAASGVAAALRNTAPIAFHYGGARTDVASALHNRAYTDVAFAGEIPAGYLKPGSYRLVLDIRAASRNAYYRVSTPVTFAVHE